MENNQVYLDFFIFYNWFGAVADHCLDRSDEFYSSASTSKLHSKHLDPAKIKQGDIVFVKTDYVYDGTFQREYLPRISEPFVLITGTSSYQVSDGYSISSLLDSDLIIKWFCTNAPIHEKIIPLPIGFQEKERAGGDQEAIKLAYDLKTPFEDKIDKILLPYHLIHPVDSTQGRIAGEARTQAINYLKSCSFVEVQTEKLPWKDYMRLLDQYKFAACLQGIGPDIHRNYEALSLHCVPINIKTIMENLFLFHNLPGLFLNSWEDLNEDSFGNYLNFNYNFRPADDFLKVGHHLDLIKKIQHENRSI